MSNFEENEISKNAFGGTELVKRRLGSLIDKELLSNFQIICSRPREFEQDKIRIFWAHDLPQDPESKRFREPEFINNIHKNVFVSNWQYNQYQLYHGVPYDDKSVTMNHGIFPFLGERDNLKPSQDGKIHIVYTSTPQRGLEILVPVFEELAKKYHNIHLDVFSSFKIYGWDDADKQFEPLFERCRNHPNITYHGFVHNDVLREHLQKSHIFAYPSIWQETACLALIEAMSAGLLCVHSDLAALPETSGSLNMMYRGNPDKNIHTKVFKEKLEYAITLYKSSLLLKYLKFNKQYVDNRYNVHHVACLWENMLSDLLKQYPTVESRKKSSGVFVYKTN